MNRENIINKSVYDISPVELANEYNGKDVALISNPWTQIYEFKVKRKDDACERDVIFHKATFENSDGEVCGLIGAIIDITEIKLIEKEKEKIIEKLQIALGQIKRLSGLLPICVSCKKIRDDQGYWKQIESYIENHSEAVFTHSVCQDCAKKLYPGLVDEKGKLKRSNI